MSVKPTVERWVVGDELAGKTLAAIIRAHEPERTWSQARALCRGGQVEVDGEQVRDDARRLSGGAEVAVFERRPRTVKVMKRVELLHVDHEVVVAVKPAGVVSVPFGERDTDSFVQQVEQALRARAKGGGRSVPPLRVVQRLDKDTTGVMVFARTRRAERVLQAQFRVHHIERRYLGLALGLVRARTHRSWLIPDRGDGLRGSWNGGKPPAFAKEAVTHVSPLEVFGGEGATTVTLVSCRLETGRQHQIRIHLAEAGHPLVGEPVYIRDHQRAGRGFFPGFEPGRGRPLLHAETLGFVHPQDEGVRRFVAPLPEDFAGVLECLKKGHFHRANEG